MLMFSKLTGTLKNKKSAMGSNIMRVFFFLFVFFLGVFSLKAETFVWTPMQEEPSFTVDIPNDWLKDYVSQKKSAKVYFLFENSQIAITSQVVHSRFSIDYLISLASAELSSQFDYLVLQEKTKLPHRKRVYRLSFLGTKENQKFIIKVFFLSENNKNLTLVCLSTVNDYDQTRVFFDNAAYSFAFSNVEKVVKPKKEKQENTGEPKTFLQYLNSVIEKVVHAKAQVESKNKVKSKSQEKSKKKKKDKK